MEYQEEWISLKDFTFPSGDGVSAFLIIPGIVVLC